MLVEFVERGPRLFVNRPLDTHVQVPETGLTITVMGYEITAKLEDGAVVVSVPAGYCGDGKPFSRCFRQGQPSMEEPQVTDLRELALYLNSPSTYYGL